MLEHAMAQTSSARLSVPPPHRVFLKMKNLVIRSLGNKKCQRCEQTATQQEQNRKMNKSYTETNERTLTCKLCTPSDGRNAVIHHHMYQAKT